MVKLTAIISKLTLLSLLILSMFSTFSRAESNWTIEQLMQSLAANTSGHASFIEKKSIAMLEKPVESSGELFYTAPDRLEKRTLKPKPESMLLDKDKMIVEQRGKKRTLQLQNYPEVAAFMLAAMLGGSVRVVMETGSTDDDLARLRRELPRACQAYLAAVN